MLEKYLSGSKLRWLFAETLVVVLGILIALGLDDYRTERYEQELAIEYLNRLQADVAIDLRYLNGGWYPRLEMKHTALDKIAPVIRGQVPVPEDLETFFRNVSRGGMQGAAVGDWVTDTTFQDMLATGNLRLIKDADVRADINLYYRLMRRQLVRIAARHTDYVQFVHTVMPGEMRDDLNLEAVKGFGVEFALERLMSDEFRSLLNMEYNLMLFMEGMQFREMAEQFQAKLDAYEAALTGGGN